MNGEGGDGSRIKMVQFLYKHFVQVTTLLVTFASDVSWRAVLNKTLSKFSLVRFQLCHSGAVIIFYNIGISGTVAYRWHRSLFIAFHPESLKSVRSGAQQMKSTPSTLTFVEIFKSV